jgi:bifunctional DNA-binding transcriptional regulator/antitoxin component of YhaV-PrlF toxin-antitoxin module
MLVLVRVRKKFQLTVPLTLRRQLALQGGDLLEAGATAEGIVFRVKHPKRADAVCSMTLLDFLKARRSQTRTRTEIDAALSADRDGWDR